MANWRQWRVHADAGTVARVTWVCGAEKVLVEEVVDFIRTTLAPEDIDYASFLATGTARDREMWASCNQYPLQERAARLVLVRDAEKIKKWEPLFSWLDNRRLLPTVHLLFISNEEDLNTELSHQAAFRDKGHIIRCSTPKPEDLIAWVQRRAECGPAVADYLLKRVGGDLGRAANVLWKASIFDGELTTELVDILSSEAPADDFVMALCDVKRARAFTAIEGLSLNDYGKVIGNLDQRLDLLTKLNAAVRKNLGLREIVQMKGVPLFLARQLIHSAKTYDAARVAHCRRLLAIVDDSMRGGGDYANPQPGQLEALVALW